MSAASETTNERARLDFERSMPMLKSVVCAFKTPRESQVSASRIVFAAFTLIAATGSALCDSRIRGAATPKKALSSSHPAHVDETGYYVPNIIGPDGKKYPIMEIPGSATVISRQLIDDQQATTLGEALRNVSGVTVRGR